MRMLRLFLLKYKLLRLEMWTTMRDRGEFLLFPLYFLDTHSDLKNLDGGIVLL